MKYSREQIKKKLTQEWNYPKSQADMVIEKLIHMDKELVKAFEAWMETGSLPDYPIIKGFDPSTAWKTYKQTPPAIFLLLDWIKREPEQALQALQEDYGKTNPDQ